MHACCHEPVFMRLPPNDSYGPLHAHRLQSMHAAVSQLALLPAAAQAQAAEAGSDSAADGSLPSCPILVGGGGMLAHAVARLAAWLKVGERVRVQVSCCA